MKRMKSQDGFTVVEVVVAIMVLSVGLLGLTATAANVTRMVAQGQRYNKATAMANERFEIMRATKCTAMAGGSAAAGAYSSSWTVAPVSGGRGNQLTVTVTSPTGRGPRNDIFVTTIPC